MTTQILVDCTVWLNEYDISADVTEVASQVEVDEIDATTFASGGNRERKGGITASQLDAMTFWDPALIEAAVYPLVGTEDNVMAATTDGAFGDTAYFVRGLVSKETNVLPVGAMARLDTGVLTSSAEGIIRGHLLVPKAARTATGTGTGRQEGAVTADQKVYALAQVFAASGTTPTLDLKVQSDDNSGFTSATDRISFTQFTDVGYELKSLAGAITDDYWRITWTIGGTSPSFSFAVVLGIK